MGSLEGWRACKTHLRHVKWTGSPSKRDQRLAIPHECQERFPFGALTFDYPGYDLKFIQRDRSKDGSDHVSTYIYKFYSPVTKYHYIVRADYHNKDTFAIKFYCKKDRRSDFKYSKIVNRKDVGNIIMSCAKVIPLLLGKYPLASFSFAASRSVDLANRTIEDYKMTQRYILYCYMIRVKFGSVTFEHITYSQISCYLLLNKKSLFLKANIEAMFRNTYQNLSEVNL
jgi:hypothetical protein